MTIIRGFRSVGPDLKRNWPSLGMKEEMLIQWKRCLKTLRLSVVMVTESANLNLLDTQASGGGIYWLI